MKLFHQIEESTILLRQNGKYTQAQLYARGDIIYAGVGKSFVKIVKPFKGTSCPQICWEEFELPEDVQTQWNSLGYLQIKP